MDDALYKIRHSLAHVLAQAVLQIRPNSKLAFGPPIDDGCYYDFLFEEPLSPTDFPDIEKRIRKIIGANQEFNASKMPLKEAIKYLEKEGQEFKVEYCKELGGRGETEIGFYTNGPFTDMCAGPHLKHTGQIPPDCFSIDSLAGAYWRGDSTRPQLTRLYCLAFSNKNELAEYKKNRELAEQRDHRKLGSELELFVISDKVGPGLPLWTPKGTAIRDELENFAKETELLHGYQRVSTPNIAKADLFYTSGHLPYYKDSMFPPMNLEGESEYYLKAMNCPHHHMIYSHRPRSYRELPLRFAEYGTCYRYEPSGTLAGLLRVRALCINDAHIYCTLDQVKDELKNTFLLTLNYYEKLRFKGVRVRVSTHDPKNKEKFVDNPELWQFSETIVNEVVAELGIDHILGEGEAAFYGPKLDFQAKTLLGREESISTTQLDFAQPLRFNLEYTDKDGSKQQPYIIHRAPFGSHERFIAFLIEHFGGAFPTWLAPVQVRIVPVNQEVLEYALKLQATLHQKLVRVEIDASDNSFNKKLREAITQKIPNIAIIGGKEAASGSVTLRRYCTPEQTNIPFDQFVERITKIIKNRVMDNFPDVEV
jgi:threonyl-tRNA synthetase